ncbi:MAG: SDR family NAD(P)-dependent oxidoreductase, partial [Phycisphaerae bacterium]
MENRVALVTGAAKRVGRAIAHHLAQGGFDIAFTYHSSGDEARALENELRHLGRRVVAVRADLTDPDTAVPDVVRGVTGEFDRLDVLVNNASLYLPANLAQTTPAVMR